MKTIVPDYYSSFACLMGACRHTCCVGWEIDIDEDSLEYYRSIPGEIGEKLSRCISQNDDTACFTLTDEERCPFLTEGGLCELILTLGEDSLCQICADHPRFRNFFSDRTEIGLGLCCEAAARLILTRKNPVRMIVSDTDGEEELLTEEENIILAMREKLTDIMQDRSLPVMQRVREMADSLYMPLPQTDFRAWAELLLSLERLDEAWTIRLENLRACADTETDASVLASDEFELAFEQLMVYLLYRHVGSAPSADDIENEVRYCIFVWLLLRRLFLLCDVQNMEQFAELARLYSSEIEYSDENLDVLHNALA